MCHAAQTRTLIVMTVGWTIMACGYFADGQKYKGSFAVMLAIGFLARRHLAKLKAMFRTGSPDT